MIDLGTRSVTETPAGAGARGARDFLKVVAKSAVRISSRPFVVRRRRAMSVGQARKRVAQLTAREFLLAFLHGSWPPRPTCWQA